jgi:septum formation inhibitor-activating ATPase MinD
MVANQDNIVDIPSSLLEQNLVVLPTGQIANSCCVTTEAVTEILTGIRDEIVDLVIVKN